MSNKIVRGNSSHRSSSYEKSPKNLSGRKRVLSAHESIEKSRDTKSLMSFMILIPIAIVILILLIILFVMTKINEKPQGFTETAPSASENISYISAEDKKKLLTIASDESPLANNYKPNLREYDGIQYDSILEEPLKELLNAAKEDGISLKITGGYISADEQDELFHSEVERLIQEKEYSRVKAENEAEKSVPRGGEHDRQTGLSVIFSSSGTFSESDGYSWLLMHAHEYGFIQRYTDNKEDETKVKADASLFRYVGRENAKKILMLGMSLDEYVLYTNTSSMQ